MAVIFNGENVGVAFPIEKQDGLQWKVDNTKNLNSEFSRCKADPTEIIKPLDLSLLEMLQFAFSNLDAPTFYMEKNMPELTSITSAFEGAKFDTVILDIPKISSLNNAFNTANGNKVYLNIGVITSGMNNSFTSSSSNYGIKEVYINGGVINAPLFNAFKQNGSIAKKIIITSDTSLVKDFSYMCYMSQGLETLETIDLYSATSVSDMFYACGKLANLKLKNIKISLRVGSGSHYGDKLTDESLIYIAKELWDLTDSTSQTLTVSRTSYRRFDNIYVKLVDITDEMIAEDQYISNKKPCVVCESTDEGAMTLREYAVSKNWTLGT